MTIPATGKTAASRWPRRPLTNAATGALLGAMALAIGSTGASAQSLLEGKSTGMRNCVQTILKSQGMVARVNVHGHDFICRRMASKSTPRGNFRQILLERLRFGIDDAVVVDFRVGGDNALVPGSLRIRTTNGRSTEHLLTDWKVSILATNSAVAYFASHYYNQTRDLKGPYSYRHLTSTQVTSLARTVPSFKTKTWETAAFQIALMTIAEHGRKAAPRPALTSRATQLKR